MKKLSAIFLSILFVGLCACGWTEPEVLSPTATNRAATETFVIPGADTKKPTVPKKVKIKTNKNDPYSYIMKVFYEKYDEKSSTAQDYVFFDIDGNGTEELLLGTGIGDGKKTIFRVYSIQNGVAVWQENFSAYGEGGNYNPSLVYKNGIIRVDGHWDGLPIISYFRFENGELKGQMSLRIEYDNYFHHDGNGDAPITKAEFDRLQKEMEGDGQVVDLDWKPMAEYGR